MILCCSKTQQADCRKAEVSGRKVGFKVLWQIVAAKQARTCHGPIFESTDLLHLWINEFIFIPSIFGSSSSCHPAIMQDAIHPENHRQIPVSNYHGDNNYQRSQFKLLFLTCNLHQVAQTTGTSRNLLFVPDLCSLP